MQTRNRSFRSSVVLPAIVVLTVAAGGFMPCLGAYELSDNFNKGLQQPWTFFVPAAANPDVSAAPAGSISGTSPGGTYRWDTTSDYLTLTATSDDPEFLAGQIDDQTFTSSLVAATINPSENAMTSDLGIMTHMNTGPDDKSLSAYALAVDPTNGALVLRKVVTGIYTILNGTPDGSGLRHGTIIPGFDASRSYKLALQTWAWNGGMSLWGTVYNASTFITSGDQWSSNQPILRVHYFDTLNPLTSGQSGLLLGRESDDAITGTFDDFSSAAILAPLIPEPASLALLALGAAGLLGCRRGAHRPG